MNLEYMHVMMKIFNVIYLIYKYLYIITYVYILLFAPQI